jgi:hypothetical protein
MSDMPGTSALQVRMGFGLHVGWAIEGAIGSEYKIDASYLSPNVNMASRLEAATKQFGTTILLSDDFVALLSPAVRRRVRQVCACSSSERQAQTLRQIMTCMRQSGVSILRDECIVALLLIPHNKSSCTLVLNVRRHVMHPALQVIVPTLRS